jgi:5'-deoxynucleotidase YfbR-like HD superfamily hydrolase
VQVDPSHLAGLMLLHDYTEFYSEDLKSAIANKMYSDFRFIVNGEPVYVHRV